MKLTSFFLLVWATVLFILGVINEPALTLCFIAVGGSIAALVGGMWLEDVYVVSKDHDEEHDLP